MRVLIPRNSGFCPGTKSAQNRILECRASNTAAPLYVYGNMINNRLYIEYLETHGITTTRDFHGIPEGSIVAIRMHGIPKTEAETLRPLHTVIDLPCANVKKFSV